MILFIHHFKLINCLFVLIYSKSILSDRTKTILNLLVHFEAISDYSSIKKDFEINKVHSSMQY